MMSTIWLCYRYINCTKDEAYQPATIKGAWCRIDNDRCDLDKANTVVGAGNLMGCVRLLLRGRFRCISFKSSATSRRTIVAAVRVGLWSCNVYAEYNCVVSVWTGGRLIWLLIGLMISFIQYYDSMKLFTDASAIVDGGIAHGMLSHGHTARFFLSMGNLENRNSFPCRKLRISGRSCKLNCRWSAIGSLFLDGQQ